MRLLTALLVVVAATDSGVVAQSSLSIATLSSRPDMVSGGDTLVEIRSGDAPQWCRGDGQRVS